MTPKYDMSFEKCTFHNILHNDDEFHDMCGKMLKINTGIFQNNEISYIFFLEKGFLKNLSMKIYSAFCL